jgi:hypothetical protein
MTGEKKPVFGEPDDRLEAAASEETQLLRLLVVSAATLALLLVVGVVGMLVFKDRLFAKGDKRHRAVAEASETAPAPISAPAPAPTPTPTPTQTTTPTPAPASAAVAPPDTKAFTPAPICRLPARRPSNPRRPPIPS